LLACSFAIQEPGRESRHLNAGCRLSSLRHPRLRFADALLFLVLKTGEMASSLEGIDVDLEYFFSKFPIGIYMRGIG
jgi:hypothetical protein